MSRLKSVLALGLITILGVAIAPACDEDQCLLACLHPLELELVLPGGAAATSAEGSLTFEGVEYSFQCYADSENFVPRAPVPSDDDMVPYVPICELVDGRLILGGIFWDGVEEVPVTLSANAGRYVFDGVVQPTHGEAEVGDGCATCPKATASVHLTGLEDSP